MKQWLLSAFFLSLAGTATPSPAQTPAPRETVAAVAQAIEDNYFDARRGKEIAQSLREANARGEFDAETAPLDLATVLTDRLEPLDRHFNVRWAPPQAGTAIGPRRAPPPTRYTGVQRVEVLPGNLGLLQLRFFGGFDFADPDAPARRAIDGALQVLAGTDALIVDLRDNGGGAPAMVGYLTSAFTPRGADIYNTFHSRQGTESEAPREWHPAPRLEVPLYLLVSARTGSAAEAFAYTLQSAGRATVLGEATAGAANPGGPVDVGHGFSVFVSDGSPINPITKRNWEGDGVQPDVAVDPAEALHAAQIRALEGLLAHSPREDALTEVRWALEALQSRDVRPARPLAELAGDYGDVRVELRDGALQFKQGRRPARRLLPLPGGEFYLADDPSRRVRFEPGALELRFADGNVSRFRRAP